MVLIILGRQEGSCPPHHQARPGHTTSAQSQHHGAQRSAVGTGTNPARQSTDRCLSAPTSSYLPRPWAQSSPPLPWPQQRGCDQLQGTPLALGVLLWPGPYVAPAKAPLAPESGSIRRVCAWQAWAQPIQMYGQAVGSESYPGDTAVPHDQDISRLEDRFQGGQSAVMVAWVGAPWKAPSSAGAWRGEGSCRGLGHRGPSPTHHLHVRQAGNFPIFPVSKQPNFLHGDLHPHPGWGTHGSCQMSLQRPAPHQRAGDQSFCARGQQCCLGCGQSEGAKARGLDPAPSTGSVHNKQANSPCQPPQHVPQGGQGPPVPSHLRASVGSVSRQSPLPTRLPAPGAGTLSCRKRRVVTPALQCLMEMSAWTDSSGGAQHLTASGPGCCGQVLPMDARKGSTWSGW